MRAKKVFEEFNSTNRISDIIKTSTGEELNEAIKNCSGKGF